jgi:putative acetyltransferase
MQIRPFDADDADAVRALLDTAFKGTLEGRIVDALRGDDADTLELVAEIDDRLVGKIMFSPVTADPAAGETLYGIGLGPVAVLPAYERQGIASLLIENGLNFIRQLGVPFCVLLGDPAFYQRFGFRPGRAIGWAWEKDPEHTFGDAFQVLSLSDAERPAGPVLARYHKAFDIDPDS